jgi:hypothetical protein
VLYDILRSSFHPLSTIANFQGAAYRSLVRLRR